MFSPVVELIFLLLCIGAAGGFLSGLLGVGGGLIFVPALYYCFGLEGAQHAMHVSVGSSLALVMATGATSAFWHHKRGAVDFAILKSWAPWIVAGVIAGITLSSAIDGGMLKNIFAVTVLCMCLYMLFSKEPEAGHQMKHIDRKMLKVICVLIGAVSSMIGIGGATLTIPTMTYNGVPMRTAIGTGGAFGTVIAVPGVIGYVLSGLPYAHDLPPWSFGYVNLLAVAVVVPVSFLLSPVGVHVSHLMPKTRLRRVFALVLALVATRMLTES